MKPNDLKIESSVSAQTINRLYQAKLGLSACLVADVTGGSVSVEQAIEKANSILHAVRPVSPGDSISAVSAEIMSFFLAQVVASRENAEALLSSNTMLERIKSVTMKISTRDFEMIRMNQNPRVARTKLAMASHICAERMPLFWRNRLALGSLISDTVFTAINNGTASKQNYVLCSLIETFAENLLYIWERYCQVRLTEIRALESEELVELLQSFTPNRGLDISSFKHVIQDTIESINSSIRGVL